MAPLTPREEFESRIQRETGKAGVKYGPAALVDTGHPEKDIHDYAINELAGLVRYADMIEARVQQFRALGHIGKDTCNSMQGMADDLRYEVRAFGEGLIGHRRSLRALLGSLGESEYREDR